MNRKRFIRRIRRELRGLPKAEIAATTEYFDESISERMERGMSEEEAVAAMGQPAEAAARILSEMPPQMREGAGKQGGFRRGMKVATLIFASPIWISLIAVVIAVAATLAAAYAAVIIGLFAASAGCIVGALGSIVLVFIEESVLPLLGIGAALVCAGTGILFGICTLISARGAVRLCRKWRGRERRVTA